jgi:hypothetical protein
LRAIAARSSIADTQMLRPYIGDSWSIDDWQPNDIAEFSGVVEPA